MLIFELEVLLLNRLIFFAGRGKRMDDQLIINGTEVSLQADESITLGATPLTGVTRVASKGQFKAVCTLAGLLALLYLLILPSITLAAPPSSGNSKNLSNTMADGSPAPYVPDAAASFAQPNVASSTPESTGFDYPVGGASAHEGFEMNNCFSCDWNDYIGHTGEDFDNGRGGDPVYATSEGVVTFRGTGPGAWGNVLIIRHQVRGSYFYSLYAHMQDMYVVAGQTVGRRQQVGIVGMTGTVAPHLHFEIKDQSLIGHGYTGYTFSGLTINDAGMNYWAPSWFIDNHRILDSPFGSFEGTGIVPGGFQIGGWVIDPNTSEPVVVHTYTDGQLSAVITADLTRPDVEAAYPAFGDKHGYGTTITASTGTHNVCVYAVNVGAGADSLLGCRQVVLDGNPIGNLESVTVDGAQMQVSGWTLDPDTASPIAANIYINGLFAGTTNATVDRSEIGAQYPAYGSAHGFSATLQPIAGDSQVCAYGVNVNGGTDKLLGCKTVRVGLESLPAASPPTGRHYYWSYYDSVRTLDWVLFANPANASTKSFDLNINGKGMNLGPFGGPAVTAAGSFSASYYGIVGGPVVATSLGGEKSIVSLRTLWKGGNSLEEVLGTEESRLSSHFYWTWYDNRTPGWFDWVLVSNPGASPIYYRIKIAGAEPAAGQTLEGAASGSIAPGQSTNARFSTMNGPVEVNTYSDPAMTIPTDAMASQRILSNMGTASEAFNELPGIPAEELADDYLWTWYDNVSPGAYDWVLIANPQADIIYYRITVNGNVPLAMIEGTATGTILPGQNVTPRIANVSDGPVEVQTFSDPGMSVPVKSIASQRVIWGPSFEEVPGTPRTSLSSNYHWTWYDQFDAGTYDWVHVINTNPYPVYYSITVGGAAPAPVVEGSASGTIAPGQRIHPRFAKRGGPVEVKACQVAFDGNGDCSSPADVMASQRVLWHGYFNEVLGIVLD
jgi:murein DD-endopeptidase MepM/ murein hydrolase activator NlpD